MVDELAHKPAPAEPNVCRDTRDPNPAPAEPNVCRETPESYPAPTKPTDDALAHHTFSILVADAGRRVDDYLASQLGWLSRIRIARLISDGHCLVNGIVARPGKKLAVGDSVEVSEPDGPPTAMTPEPIPLQVVYEDEHVMVVVKPAGMLVHPTIGVKRGTLANGLVYHLNRDLSGVTGGAVIRPGIVHRLDKATSGLMVVAKTPRALSVLSKHFRRKLVKKRYLALVNGRIVDEEKLISAPIGRDPDRRPHWGVMEAGKPSETRLRVLERRDGATFVELEPITGRTNQLRIHCAFLGHPILGDSLYGPGMEEHDNGQTASPRLFLHACKLGFHHPQSGEWIEVEDLVNW